MASEIVDLRIGAHPNFTRIVFELDRPTGYRIERASPEPGVSELVVSIDATSIPRKVKNKDALIGMVTITPRGKGSLAEIRLTREGLRLKEMILSSPPRIVLDIMASPVAKKAPSAAPAMATKTSPAKKKKPVGKPVVKPKSQSKSVCRTQSCKWANGFVFQTETWPPILTSRKSTKRDSTIGWV